MITLLLKKEEPPKNVPDSQHVTQKSGHHSKGSIRWLQFFFFFTDSYSNSYKELLQVA